ncbi:MAG: NAD-dependent epimerase/dehydratase family protein [Phycisphaerales bacterium]|nr:NAD-dependent epimerase/dehydratase family protein [Phycisphaerales bacterium]
MKILVLGGTQFSGRAFVEQAVGAGHEITLLHRSPVDPGLPDGVRRLVGDRDPEKGGGLGEIQKLFDNGERFDAVLDMCGYVPRVTQASCELLRDACDLYVFTSTVSVYDKDHPEEVPDEDSKLIDLEDKSVEEVNGETYGGLKVLCEQVVRAWYPENHCILRPTVIAGPNDPTDRVTWWTRMLGTLDAMVVPAEPSGLAGFIDSRDLAAFFLRCIEHTITGTYNTVGPEVGLGMRSFIDRSRAALDSKTELIEVDADRLSAHGIEAWKDIPTWAPEESQFMYRISSQRALDQGLTLRPLEDTMRAVRAWDVERGEPELKAGISADRMRELVQECPSS